MFVKINGLLRAYVVCLKRESTSCKPLLRPPMSNCRRVGSGMGARTFSPNVRCTINSALECCSRHARWRTFRSSFRSPSVHSSCSLPRSHKTWPPTIHSLSLSPIYSITSSGVAAVCTLKAFSREGAAWSSMERERGSKHHSKLEKIWAEWYEAANQYLFAFLRSQPASASLFINANVRSLTQRDH